VLVQWSATYGSPAKQNYLAAVPLTNCINYMVHPVVLCFMNLPSLQHLVLHTYEKAHCAVMYCMLHFGLSLWNMEIRS